MIVIPVRVCGDSWGNGLEVKNLLEQTPKDSPICLDFLAEGPSIHAIGLNDMLDQFCINTGRSADTISIINNPNVTENTVYKNLTPKFNHLLILIKNYWQQVSAADPDAKKFAFFMGRRTIARSWILYDLYHNFQNEFLLSHMNNSGPDPWIQPPQGINLEKKSDWIPTLEYDNFINWFKACPVTSIDGNAVCDQYRPNKNTNQELLQHYNKFQIELVAETYTIGDTFFPTEKTFRPIMAARPILVYGPKNFLKRLRDLGLETYSACWDESYDQLEGPERWNALRKVIQNIEITDACWNIANRNRQRLEKIVYDHRDI